MQIFQVLPDIPEIIISLEKISRNIWWCWQKDAVALFHRMAPILWDNVKENPISLLSQISQKELEILSKDKGFLAHLKRVEKCFYEMQTRSCDNYKSNKIIAYFSMEFGIHESIPIFSGGLGILAGDHLKASSDLNMPIVGIGLLYREGYFRQYLDGDGLQQEEYPKSDLFNLPVKRATNKNGDEIKISIAGPDGLIHAILWELMIGAVPLYLLDTELPENTPQTRDITARLYGGEDSMRLAQEILLGIGGMIALHKLGIYPSVCHMNEGHSAFSSIERMAQIMSTYNIDIKTALEIIPRTSIFTTHTPVAAGHDEFPPDLVAPYLKPFEKRLGVTVDEMIKWGQLSNSNSEQPFSMFVLGLRMSMYCNGVSLLHGKVARRMWSHMWPERPDDEVPINHITNGIHITSWLSKENAGLFENYLGPDWCIPPHNPDLIKNIDNISDDEIWRSHELNRSNMVVFCRKQLKKQYKRRNAPKSVMDKLDILLNPYALTIVFARRFATYKRATLIESDTDRLEAILTSEKYPVQIIFSGKAHPKDNEGKDFIKQIFKGVNKPKVQDKIIFIEDYDINIARILVQGADVWLNTPRRPLEACGTSGMKAAINGTLNISTLDGWWCEGYSEKCGWSIGKGEEYADHNYQDAVESQALYNILENDVIPCFYERETSNVPIRWIKMMKESMKMSLLQYCSHRMVNEYDKKFYLSANKNFTDFLKDNAKLAQEMFQKRQRLIKHWKNITISTPEREKKGPFRVGKTLSIKTIVYLGDLKPDEVKVQVYYGLIKSLNTVEKSNIKEMTVSKNTEKGEYVYTCIITCQDSGRYGYTARVIPNGDDFIKAAPGLMTWANVVD